MRPQPCAKSLYLIKEKEGNRLFQSIHDLQQFYMVVESHLPISIDSWSFIFSKFVFIVICLLKNLVNLLVSMINCPGTILINCWQRYTLIPLAPLRYLDFSYVDPETHRIHAQFERTYFLKPRHDNPPPRLISGESLHLPKYSALHSCSRTTREHCV